MLKGAIKLSIFSAVIMTSAVLSGCNDDTDAAIEQATTDAQSAIDQRNAEIERKNTVRSQIK